MKSAKFGKHLVVVYKEVSSQDEFIITAWRTSKANRLKKKKVEWL